MSTEEERKKVVLTMRATGTNVNYIDVKSPFIKKYFHRKNDVILVKLLPGAPNSAKFRVGYRGPSKIRQMGGCNNFLLFTR